MLQHMARSLPSREGAYSHALLAPAVLRALDERRNTHEHGSDALIAARAALARVLSVQPAAIQDFATHLLCDAFANLSPDTTSAAGPYAPACHGRGAAALREQFSRLAAKGGVRLLHSKLPLCSLLQEGGRSISAVESITHISAKRTAPRDMDDPSSTLNASPADSERGWLSAESNGSLAARLNVEVRRFCCRHRIGYARSMLTRLCAACSPC